MADPSELKNYLKNAVNPVIEPLVVEILKQRPNDIPDFIVTYFQNRKTGSSGPSKPKTLVSPKVPPQVQFAANSGSSSEDDDEEDADEAKFQLAKIQQAKTKPRGSVSAEVYGRFNKKEDFQARAIKKSAEQKQRILERLSTAFMFAHLEEKEKEIIVNAMEEKTMPAGSWVIKQGDDGNELYVIDQGKLECYKQFSKDQEPKYLKTYVPGESFGELALLYNAPRAASIKAVENAVLFALDRPTFNNIVKDAEVRRRERFETILSKIELLDGMDPYERSKVADAALTLNYKAGQVIIKEGERGDRFYFVENGEAVATKTLKGKSEAETVFNYKPGDYFGELALLKDAPRAANVLASTDLTVLALDRDAFTRVLGPLTDILKRNTKKYEKFM